MPQFTSERRQESKVEEVPIALMRAIKLTMLCPMVSHRFAARFEFCTLTGLCDYPVPPCFFGISLLNSGGLTTFSTTTNTSEFWPTRVQAYLKSVVAIPLSRYGPMLSSAQNVMRTFFGTMTSLVLFPTPPRCGQRMVYGIWSFGRVPGLAEVYR